MGAVKDPGMPLSDSDYGQALTIIHADSTNAGSDAVDHLIVGAEESDDVITDGGAAFFYERINSGAWVLKNSRAAAETVAGP